LAAVKSNLLKQLADSYPNFLRKDLSKLLDIIYREIPIDRVDKVNIINRCIENLARAELIRINADKTVEYNDGFEKWFSSAIPSLKGREVVKELVEYYFPRGYCLVPAKQKPGTQRPDIIAIPFNPKNKRFRYNDSIAIEVESHLDKGPNTREQAKKNTTKNTEFKGTHVWTFPEYREIIMKIYNELSENDKKKVKILFFGEEVIILKDNSTQQSEKRRHQTTRKTYDSKELQTLDKFYKPKDDTRESKESKSKVDNSSITNLNEKEEKTEVIEEEIKEEEEQHDTEDSEDENIVRIAWNNRTYILEKDKDSEIIMEIIKDIGEGTRTDLSVAVKGDTLKIIDERGITVAKAKILRVV